MSQYVDVEIMTQDAVEAQWGSFDFENVVFDPKTGEIVKDFDDFEKRAKPCETCMFTMRGTSYIARTSKSEMA
jgi:formamidopyrimidine-DNA glycosylase